MECGGCNGVPFSVVKVVVALFVLRLLVVSQNFLASLGNRDGAVVGSFPSEYTLPLMIKWVTLYIVDAVYEVICTPLPNTTLILVKVTFVHM